MIQARTSPDGKLQDLTALVVNKIGALHAAQEAGARFLALPVSDNFEAATWILACFYSRISAVPLPASLPSPVLDARIAQLPAGQTIFPDQLTPQRPKIAMVEPRPLDEIWAVVFTSGSSGSPKGVAISGAALKASAEMHAAHSDAGKVPWLLDLPLFHVGGLSILTRAFFLAGEVAFGGAKFDSASTAVWIRSGTVSGLSLVPTTLARLLREPKLDFSRLRLVLLGGGPVTEELCELARTQSVPVRLTYGMTESSSQIATEKTFGGGLEALPGVELQLGEDGEILAQSPALASGYFQNGRLQPLAVNKNGFLATGDLGNFESNRLRIMGRKTDLIISGGKKIFPVEVENAISGSPAIADCAVVGVSDPEWGELLCAAYVELEGAEFDLAREKARLASLLEGHKIPKRWLKLESIPRNSTGKIDRAELRKIISSRS